MWCHKAAGGGIANLTEMTTALTAALTVEKDCLVVLRKLFFFGIEFHTEKKTPAAWMKVFCMTTLGIFFALLLNCWNVNVRYFP